MSKIFSLHSKVINKVADVLVLCLKSSKSGVLFAVAAQFIGTSLLSGSQGPRVAGGSRLDSAGGPQAELELDVFPGRSGT